MYWHASKLQISSVFLEFCKTTPSPQVSLLMKWVSQCPIVLDTRCADISHDTEKKNLNLCRFSSFMFFFSPNPPHLIYSWIWVSMFSMSTAQFITPASLSVQTYLKYILDQLYIWDTGDEKSRDLGLFVLFFEKSNRENLKRGHLSWILDFAKNSLCSPGDYFHFSLTLLHIIERFFSPFSLPSV